MTASEDGLAEDPFMKFEDFPFDGLRQSLQEVAAAVTTIKEYDVWSAPADLPDGTPLRVDEAAGLMVKALHSFREELRKNAIGSVAASAEPCLGGDECNKGQALSALVHYSNTLCHGLNEMPDAICAMNKWYERGKDETGRDSAKKLLQEQDQKIAELEKHQSERATHLNNVKQELAQLKIDFEVASESLRQTRYELGVKESELTLLATEVDKLGKKLQQADEDLADAQFKLSNRHGTDGSGVESAAESEERRWELTSDSDLEKQPVHRSVPQSEPVPAGEQGSRRNETESDGEKVKNGAKVANDNKSGTGDETTIQRNGATQGARSLEDQSTDDDSEAKLSQGSSQDFSRKDSHITAIPDPPLRSSPSQRVNSRDDETRAQTPPSESSQSTSSLDDLCMRAGTSDLRSLVLPETTEPEDVPPRTTASATGTTAVVTGGIYRVPGSESESQSEDSELSGEILAYHLPSSSEISRTGLLDGPRGQSLAASGSSRESSGALPRFSTRGFLGGLFMQAEDEVNIAPSESSHDSQGDTPEDTGERVGDDTQVELVASYLSSSPDAHSLSDSSDERRELDRLRFYNQRNAELSGNETKFSSPKQNRFRHIVPEHQTLLDALDDALHTDLLDGFHYSASSEASSGESAPKCSSKIKSAAASPESPPYRRYFRDSVSGLQPGPAKNSSPVDFENDEESYALDDEEPYIHKRRPRHQHSYHSSAEETEESQEGEHDHHPDPVEYAWLDAPAPVFYDSFWEQRLAGDSPPTIDIYSGRRINLRPAPRRRRRGVLDEDWSPKQTHTSLPEQDIGPSATTEGDGNAIEVYPPQRDPRRVIKPGAKAPKIGQLLLEIRKMKVEETLMKRQLNWLERYHDRMSEWEERLASLLDAPGLENLIFGEDIYVEPGDPVPEPRQYVPPRKRDSPESEQDDDASGMTEEEAEQPQRSSPVPDPSQTDGSSRADFKTRTGLFIDRLTRLKEAQEASRLEAKQREGEAAGEEEEEPQPERLHQKSRQAERPAPLRIEKQSQAQKETQEEIGILEVVNSGRESQGEQQGEGLVSDDQMQLGQRRARAASFAAVDRQLHERQQQDEQQDERQDEQRQRVPQVEEPSVQTVTSPDEAHASIAIDQLPTLIDVGAPDAAGLTLLWSYCTLLMETLRLLSITAVALLQFIGWCLLGICYSVREGQAVLVIDNLLNSRAAEIMLGTRGVQVVRSALQGDKESRRRARQTLNTAYYYSLFLGAFMLLVATMDGLWSARRQKSVWMGANGMTRQEMVGYVNQTRLWPAWAGSVDDVWLGVDDYGDFIWAIGQSVHFIAAFVMMYVYDRGPAVMAAAVVWTGMVYFLSS